MNGKKLTNSATHLNKFSSQAVKEYSQKRQTLVASINEAMLNRLDITELVGEKNIQMMKDNHSNHALFVESFMINPDPGVLVDTVLWVFRSYRSRGFHQNYWAAQLNCWIEILKLQLSEDSFNDVYPLYQWFTVNIPAFTDLSDKELNPSSEVPEH
jgi:hypothetical protein